MEIGPPVPEKKIFEWFYHIWAWRPFWSCDPDAVNKISFPQPKEAPHKIWLSLAKRFRRRRSLSIVNDGRTTRTDGRMPDHEYPISSPMSLWHHISKEVHVHCTFFKLSLFLALSLDNEHESMLKGNQIKSS